MGVGHLAPDDAADGLLGEEQGEAPAGYAAVEHGVGGEFGDDQRDRLVRRGAVRVPPLGELVRGRQPGKTAPRGVAEKRRVGSPVTVSPDAWAAFGPLAGGAHG
jgi:hypothetical protein